MAQSAREKSSGPTSVTQDDIDETAKLLGVSPTGPTEHTPGEIEETAKLLGVTVGPKTPIGRSGQPVDIPPVTALPGQDPWVTRQPKRYLRGVAQSALEGVPVLGAAAEHALAAMMPGQYKKNLEGIRSEGEDFTKNNPIASIMSGLAGGGAAMGPFAMTPVGGAMMGLRGATGGIRAVAGGASGAAMGGTDEALRGGNPVSGAEIGGGMGFAAPLLSKLAAWSTQKGLNALPQAGPLRGTGSTAIQKLTQAFEGETPASITDAKRRMGPAGFMGDLNTGATDLAGGLADLPGSKAAVREAYRLRKADQPNRVKQALDDNIGPAANLEDIKHLVREERKKLADPLYDMWRKSEIHPTDEIKALIPRLEKAGAFSMAEELSGITGRPITKAHFTSGDNKQFPTAESWDYVKRGLDRRIDSAYSDGDKTLGNALVGLKNEMITELEKTKGGKVWAQGRKEWADKSALLDQIAAGKDTFLGGRSGLSADELANEIKGLSPPELAARQLGLRHAAEEVMGATTRGDTTLVNKILAPNNIRKMELLLGKDKAKSLVQSMEQESYLLSQHQNVVGGSQTTPKKERVNALEAPPVEPWGFDFTKPATYLPPILRNELEINNMRAAWRGSNHDKARNQLAPLLTLPASDPRFDLLVDAIQKESGRRGGNALLAARGGNALTGLTTGVVSPAAQRQYERQ